MNNEKELTYPYHFTTRQLQCVLVGLRMLQDAVDEYGIDAVSNQWPHFDEEACLSSDELEDLCMDINC